MNDGLFLLDRIENALNEVRERLLRATSALHGSAIPYAVAGDFAVGNWVASVDESAVRNSVKVEILFRRSDLPGAISAMQEIGFAYQKAGRHEFFLDGSNTKMRDNVQLLFSGEKVRENDAFCNPDVNEAVAAKSYQVLTLEALVRIKLTAYRDVDRVHLSDLLDVGLIDAAWLTTLPAELASRLKTLIDTPDG